jgi:hypothetical protein
MTVTISREVEYKLRKDICLQHKCKSKFALHNTTMVAPTGEMHCLLELAGGVLVFLENKIIRHGVPITLQELGAVPE